MKIILLKEKKKKFQKVPVWALDMKKEQIGLCFTILVLKPTSILSHSFVPLKKICLLSQFSHKVCSKRIRSRTQQFNSYKTQRQNFKRKLYPNFNITNPSFTVYRIYNGQEKATELYKWF